FLCLGSDGHFGIETESCESHCESETPADHDDFPSSPGSPDLSGYSECKDDESCGTSIDILLPLGEATSRLLRSGSESVKRSPLVSLAGLPESIVAGLAADGENNRCMRFDAAGVSIAPLRAIILLI
ncbi:MAG: hypothetical protein GY794_18850, partial [bacterium]|nr:hypothetical protein [bacterium]